MKKLFLLGVITMLLASCQKTTIEPFNGPQNNIIQSQCGPLGDCYSGSYLFDSVRTMDPNINTTGTDTIVTGLIVKIEYNGDTLRNGNIFIKYKLDSVTCSLPFISQASINAYNHFNWLKNTTYSDGVSLQTKTGKVMIFWKI